MVLVLKGHSITDVDLNQAGLIRANKNLESFTKPRKPEFISSDSGGNVIEFSNVLQSEILFYKKYKRIGKSQIRTVN